MKETELVTRPATDLDNLCINTIRFLSVDAVQKANSGHPGMPMGAAPMAYTLWDKLLRFNPKDPHWHNRDRFVLSGGHGSMLLYSLLHLFGYDLTMEDIKAFRQWESKTPGHPEYGLAPGVEATTGPLGQGISNAVGMAIAEAHLAARFNRPEFNIMDHFTYVLASDGDLMEGVASEAASLAGHLKLGKLIVLYDDNHISIEGSTDIAFTEDRLARFASYGWHTQKVEDGNDIESVGRAIEAARKEHDRPSIIAVRTHIGFGSPNKQNKASAHGEPLGEEEVGLAKDNLGWPREPAFLVPAEVKAYMGQAVERGEKWQKDWNDLFSRYSETYPELALEYTSVIDGKLPDEWEKALPVFSGDTSPIATRAASGKVINAIAGSLPELMGGSADLAPSNKTMIDKVSAFQHGQYEGRNMHFGVREHGMGAILNGMAYHGGILPYGGTFLIFSDYMRPSIRLAALSNLHVIYVLTHDSIGLGEDGPTHQPVEQLLSLRAIPNFLVIRPADANETAEAWRIAINHRNGPVALALSRQKLPVLDLDIYPNLREGVRAGAYILKDMNNFNLILVATGAEVHLALSAQERLLEDGIRARVVSMPCWELFAEQPSSYREHLFPPGLPILAIEAGVTLGWKSYTGSDEGFDVIGVDRFGASAPAKVIMEKYGLTVDNVCEKAKALINKV